jgi:hypothetical protein
VHHHPPHTHKAKKGKTFTVHSVALLPFLLQVPKRADGPRKRDTRFSPEARKGNADMKRRPSRAINRLSFEQLVDKTPGQHFSIGNDYKTGREVRRERTNDQGRQVHFINLDSVPGRGQPSDNRQTVLDRPWPVRPRMARLPNNTYLSIGQMNKKERTGSTMATCWKKASPFSLRVGPIDPAKPVTAETVDMNKRNDHKTNRRRSREKTHKRWQWHFTTR